MTGERWRLLDVSDLVELAILEDTFPGQRPLPAQYDPDLQATPPKMSN